MTMKPVKVDLDYAYSGTVKGDTVYFDVEERKSGWFMGAVIDCESGHFLDSLAKCEGPYTTETEAMRAGVWAAREWFDLNWTGKRIFWDTRIPKKARR